MARIALQMICEPGSRTVHLGDWGGSHVGSVIHVMLTLQFHATVGHELL
jgi:hypothetical protein